MDCPAALRELAVMNHDLKCIIYRVEQFNNKPPINLPIHQSMKAHHLRNLEKYHIANDLNNMMTKHRARISELQILTGCQTDYMKVYNTGVSVCEFH